MLHDMLVKVDSFILLANFVIYYCEVDFEIPIFIGRPFSSTGHALVNMENGMNKSHLTMKNRLLIFVGS